MSSRDEDGGEPAVLDAIRADAALTGRQRQALVQVYEAFAAQNGKAAPKRRRRPAAD